MGCVSSEEEPLDSSSGQLQEPLQDFPGDAIVKNPPANAGDTSSIPGPGTKTPHALGQLSPCATRVPLRPGTCALQQEKPSQQEAHAPELEKALAQQQRPSATKINQF